jgi:hypothetical protein
MPNFLVGSAYAVSTGLIVYGITSRIIPSNLHFPVIMMWALAGLLLGFAAIWRRRD